MADKKATTKKAAADPTMTTAQNAPEYPEGTHPARDPGDVTHTPDRFEYRDNQDKPDPSSVAQVQVTDRP